MAADETARPGGAEHQERMGEGGDGREGVPAPAGQGATAGGTGAHDPARGAAAMADPDTSRAAPAAGGREREADLQGE